MKNREILFRGIRAETKEWVYGVPLKDATSTAIFIVNNASVEFTGSPALWEVIPETVGQFINETDQHEEMLFVGDRIRFNDYPDEVFTIVFYRGSYCAESEHNVPQQARIHYKWQNFCQPSHQPYIPIKVGTIHDHLLKGG